jgi:hypothetical protein
MLITSIETSQRIWRSRELKEPEKIKGLDNCIQFIIIDYGSVAENKFALLKKKLTPLFMFHGSQPEN